MIESTLKSCQVHQIFVTRARSNLSISTLPKWDRFTKLWPQIGTPVPWMRLESEISKSTKTSKVSEGGRTLVFIQLITGLVFYLKIPYSEKFRAIILYYKISRKFQSSDRGKNFSRYYISYISLRFFEVKKPYLLI